MSRMIRHILPTFVTLLLAATLLAEEPKELIKARTEYEHSAPHAEAARSAYVLRLMKLREEFGHANNTEDWKAVDAEIGRNPLPNDADSKALSQMLVGKWGSRTHDYLYKSDGSWTMIPEGPGVAHGKWRIDGNQIHSWITFEPNKTRAMTLILLNDKNFVCADHGSVFYETRLEK